MFNPDLVQAHGPAGIRPRAAAARIGEDRPWLTVMAAVTAIELAWWAAVWLMGHAPAPYLLTYIALSFAGLGSALVVRALLSPRAAAPNWWSVIPATLLVAIGASLFLPLKYAIPQIVPFWLDPMLASGERAVFGGEPWSLIDQLAGWAIVPVDRLYGLWLPTQSLILFTVMMQPASAAKSRLLIAYVLTWSLLGVVAALLLSSAGPIFHDRIFGGSEFAPLREMLDRRGAWLVLAESDRMWASLATGRPTIVAGISAAPSIHVAISVWIWLAARTMAPRLAPFALVYALFMWFGSVQLGWHYVTDGLLGALGVLAIWACVLSLTRSPADPV
jgi:hypothetical protein